MNNEKGCPNKLWRNMAKYSFYIGVKVASPTFINITDEFNLLLYSEIGFALTATQFNMRPLLCFNLQLLQIVGKTISKSS